GRLSERQPDPEGGAAADMAFEFDAAVMGADDPLDDHQAEARAFFLGGEEGFENAIDIVLRDTTAGLGDADPNAVSARAGSEGEHAALGHCLHGVLDEIDEHLLEL